MKDRKQSDFRRGIFRRSLLVRYEGPGGEVVIPNGVKKIGSYAFSACWKMTGIVVPAGVRSVGDGAFEGCTGLARLILPDSVTDIGWELFGLSADSLRELQADGIPSVEMMDNDWDPCDLVPPDPFIPGRTWVEKLAYRLLERILESKGLPAGFSINKSLVGPLLRNFARRYLSGEEIPAEIARDRMQYIRRKMLGMRGYYAMALSSTRSDILQEAARFADSPELLHLLFQEGLVESGDVSVLMAAADCRGGDAMRALVCECVLRYFPDAEPEELAI